MKEELVTEEKCLKVEEGWRGLTVLDAVRNAFPQLGVREVFKKCRMGEIVCEGGRCQPMDRLEVGDILRVTLHRPPKPEEKPVLREDFWLNTSAGAIWIVHEDEDLIAVSKPPHCASHPALGHSGDTLIERIRLALGTDEGDEFQPALANRLDMETSGIVLVGKNRIARQKLGRFMQKREVEKRYLCLVAGRPADEGEITLPLIKRPDSRDLAMYKEGHPRLKPREQSAHTRYRVIDELDGAGSACLVEVELLTGRNHQIRRHFTAAGHPVAMDRRYGEPGFNHWVADMSGLDRMFLHAYKVALNHPATGQHLELVAPLHDDLARALERLGGDPAAALKRAASPGEDEQ